MSIHEIVANTAIRGIAIKHCVSGASLKGFVAHAHIETGPFHGWICLASSRHYNPTTLIHELAHLISGEEDERSVAWIRAVRELGGRVERNYR